MRARRLRVDMGTVGFLLSLALSGCQETGELASGEGARTIALREEERKDEHDTVRRSGVSSRRRSYRSSPESRAEPRRREGSEGSEAIRTARRSPRGDRSPQDDGVQGSSRGESGESRDPERLRSIPDQELLVSLEGRSLPGGVYEVDRSSPKSTGLWPTEKELEEFLERVNARNDWMQVIRVGPWRIRIFRDTFFDPYRRDSGWIDIDRLDGPHGR